MVILILLSVFNIKMNTLSKLQKHMTGRKALLPLSLVLSSLSALAAMIPYILIWFIIREFITVGASSQTLIYTYAWWAAGLAVGSVLVYFTALSISHLAAFRVECNMRRYAMKKIVNMPLGFFNNNTTGRIRKIIDENASITHGFLAHQMPDLAGSAVMPFAAVVMIFVFDWRLGLACLVPLLSPCF
jgi:ATP-binding cassette, subfamily B, bacterial IrtA/YbtP